MTPSLEAGMQASAEGDSAQALALYEQAAAEAPGSGLPHFLAGGEYASMGQMDKAEAAFANALLLAPGFAVARYQLGLLQYSSARAAVALVTWQPLLALPEDSPLPYFVRGFAALAQDSFQDALALFDAGIERNTDNPPMTSDIRKVIAGIEAVLSQQAGSSTHDTAIEQQEPEESEDAQTAHILLSNYRQQGPAH
jgi:tetratricopeptide (TPR) repeat protein